MLSLGTELVPIKLAVYDGGVTSCYGLGIASGQLLFGAAINPSSGTPQMVLTNTGNVGIGSTNPSYQTQIVGSGANVVGDGGYYFPGHPGGTLYLVDTQGAAGTGGTLLFGFASQSTPFAAIHGYATNGSGPMGNLVFYLRPTTGDSALYPRMTLDSNGNLNIVGQYQVNGAAFGGSITVQGNGATAGTRPILNFTTGSSMSVSTIDDGANNRIQISYGYVSDLRLKQHVTDLSGGLPIIQRLRPVEYEWNGLAGREAGQRAVAIVAQELKEVLPHCVYPVRVKLRPEDEEPQDVLAYEPTEIVMHLVLAVQQLSQELKALRRGVN